MAWDYAELSKLAKKSGGPEKLVESLFEMGKESGRNSMMPVVVGALGVGTFLGMGVCHLVRKIKQYLREKDATTEVEVEAVKQELIQGIIDYDEAHPEAGIIDEHVGEDNDINEVADEI